MHATVLLSTREPPFKLLSWLRSIPHLSPFKRVVAALAVFVFATRPVVFSLPTLTFPPALGPCSAEPGSIRASGAS